MYDIPLYTLDIMCFMLLKILLILTKIYCLKFVVIVPIVVIATNEKKNAYLGAAAPVA